MRGAQPLVHTVLMSNPARRSVIFALLVSLLTSAFSWAFDGAVSAHELDHERHVLATDPASHLDLHRQSDPDGDADLDAATHLYMHAVGHLQPYFPRTEVLVALVTRPQLQARFIPAFCPDFVRDLPLRPPRTPLSI